MKILFFEDHDVWIHGLPQALRRLGHVVYVPREDEGPRELRGVLDQWEPELVLTMGWTPRHTPENLRLLRDHCRPRPVLHVYWSAEDPAHTDVWTLDYLERAEPDAVPSISPTTVPLLREMGYASEELPFGCDPLQYRPQEPDPRYATDIALIATLYTSATSFRWICLERLLRPLLGSDLRVGIWGRGWEHARSFLGLDLPEHWLRGPAAVREAPLIYSSTRLALAPQNETSQLTSRTFEALSCGAALLTARTPAVLRFFRDGEHLLCSDSAAETGTQVRRCLADPGLRRHLGGAGRAAVLADHTYDRRAARLLQWSEAWLAEKRRNGRVASGSRRRRQPLYLVDCTPWPAGRPQLRFDLPPARPGEHLESATLQCFADTIAHGGVAVCRTAREVEAGDRLPLTERGRPTYPFDACWCRWTLTDLVARCLGSSLQVSIDAEEGLEAIWGGPGWDPDDAVLTHRQLRFWPRLILVWGLDADG